MRVPKEDLLGLIITLCVILAGSALRCAGYLAAV